MMIGQSGPQSASGALAASREEVGNALGSTGFVYITGQIDENFSTYLDRKSFGIDVGDLKPGILPDLRSWVSSVLSSEDSDQALQAQARVRPERAITLLR
jgi:hypothetical protein